MPARSPYHKYGKTPYPYVFRRCSHMREGQPATHVEAFGATSSDQYGTLRTVAKVMVCDICNTMQGKAFDARTYEEKVRT